MKVETILENFDGTMSSIKITPKGGETRIEFKTKIYKDDKKVKCDLIYQEVAFYDFQINSFEGCVGSELYGLYEILDNNYKKDLIEKIFLNRRKIYIDTGYDYDENNVYDVLNFHELIDEFEEYINDYHLYIQNIDAGCYIILANNLDIKY